MHDVAFTPIPIRSRLKSWSWSWTNRRCLIRSYQNLIGMGTNLGNRLHRIIFLSVKNFSPMNTINFNRANLIRSHHVVTKRSRSHLLVLFNRSDRNQSWTRQAQRSVKICCGPIRSVAIYRVTLHTINYDRLASRYELKQ